MAAPTLFTNPFKTLYYFSIVLSIYLRDAIKYLSKYWYVIAFLILIIVGPRYFDGGHRDLVIFADEIAYFSLYWLVLGIMSSIGLGTGLHTFVLYLGPHIAKVTIQSYECNSVPNFVPNKYNTEYTECPENALGVTIWDIFRQVYLETVLFGIGTAIGELPPYFVARAAALANKRLEELEEVQEAKKEHTFMARMKVLIYEKLQKNAFLTVLLCASIPNPLFDLAGITCGHFLIPFSTFFGATVTGKAFIKMHLQMPMTIFVFSKEHVESLLSLIKSFVPVVHKFLNDALEKQKAQLHNPSLFKEGTKPLVAQLWDYFIFFMIGFFLISIVNSLVAQYVADEEQKSKPSDDKKKRDQSPPKKQETKEKNKNKNKKKDQ